jgi:hypothetical protein
MGVEPIEQLERREVRRFGELLWEVKLTTATLKLSTWVEPTSANRRGQQADVVLGQ